MEPTGVQKKKRVHKYMRHLSCISRVMEPTGVRNSTSIGSTCNYTADICQVCLSGQSDGSVGPPDRSVDSADRSAGRWVGRRHRADTEASVISPTTSHSNSEHCPRKKTSRLRRPAAGTPLLSGPTMLHGLESCGFSTSPSHLSIGGPQTSRGTVLPEASSGFVTFFPRAVTVTWQTGKHTQTSARPSENTPCTTDVFP